MNRRQFTKSLVAAGLAPALPIPALSKAAPAATMARDPLYLWANFVTRVHNKTSPDMISRLLKVDAEHGAKLYAQLIQDGALTAPDAFGLSQSTNPLYPEYSKVMSHGKKAIETVQKANNTKPLEDMTSDAAPAENDEAPKEHEEPQEPLQTSPEDAPEPDQPDGSDPQDPHKDHPDFTSS